MGISGVALQPKTTGSPSPKNDSSAEIQKLEQQKRDIRQQIKQLEQSKQGGDAIQKAKNNLQKQLQEIDRQIQTLKQQGTQETQETQKATEAPPAEEAAQARPPRFDEYVKNDKEASSAGIYNVEKDENGNPLITFDSPDKPSQESPDTAKPSMADAEMKKLTEQRQAIQQQLKQVENSEERAVLQKQLTNVETELRAKDNDAYRKQNATYTYSKEN